MATLDDSVQNLQQFIGELTTATGALDQVTSHLDSSARELADLDSAVAEHAGGLNDDLEEFGTQLESAETEAVQAVEDVGQAAGTAQDTLEDARGQVEHAADEFETQVQAVMTALDTDDQELTAQGFTLLSQAVDEAESELEAERQDAEQAFTEMADGVHTLETESQAVWDAADQAVDQAAAEAAAQESSLEGQATEATHGFETATSEFTGACQTLEAELGAIYEGCVTGIDAEADQLDHGLEGLAQEAVAFVERGEHERLEAPADLVEKEALGGLHEEYTTLGHFLETAQTVAQDLDPLADDLEKSQGVCADVDRLISAFGG
jgi:chromosome segregation ATPase